MQACYGNPREMWEDLPEAQPPVPVRRHPKRVSRMTELDYLRLRRYCETKRHPVSREFLLMRALQALPVSDLRVYKQRNGSEAIDWAVVDSILSHQQGQLPLDF